MILRRVVDAEPCDAECVWNLALECGHILGWVIVRQRFPKRKRCVVCEIFDEFAAKRPGDYRALLDLAGRVPKDDRTQAMLGWLAHYLRAEEYQARIPGLEFGIALRLADMGGLYPLPLDGDDWEQSAWAE